MSPGIRKRELPKFRVVCQGDEERITLLAKAADKYEACEQINMFLRSKGFAYQIVLIEPS
jgi:hypothetical protein